MDNIAKLEGKNLVIRIPIDNIKSAVEQHPHFWQVKVKNKKEFSKELAVRILDFDEDETGVPAFFRLLDEITAEMIEDASEHVKVKFNEGDDWQ